jgi:hypothetical protein
MDILSAVHNPEITCVCRVTGVTGHCDTCGVVVIGLHMPDVAHGWYCADHCPCRAYQPGAEEVRAMKVNAARMLGSRDGRALRVVAKAKPKVRRVYSTEARRQAALRALRQWSDPKARARIVAGVRRGCCRA